MRRQHSLAVDTSAPAAVTTYELTQSQRSSTYTASVDLKDSPTNSIHEQPAKVEQRPPQPSIRLLFSLLSTRKRVLFLFPAVLSSLISGGIAPFMTYVIGRSFDAFSKFPLSNPSDYDKEQLLRGVGLAALELVGLAVSALALSSVTSCLWIWTGEHNVMAVRRRVYMAVTTKDMAWFDTKMGSEGNVQSTKAEQGPVGAGGLMTKFAKETDDVRMASSLAFGMLVQYATTCLVCLALAFSRSWSLTLVILSAVPLLMAIQAFSQAFAGPLLSVERAQAATAGTLVDRAIVAIATVKAFNAVPHELSALNSILDRIRGATRKLNAVWGFTSCLSQFVMMSMFVQGFWFGAKLVRDGKISTGDVMSVFWACLIATSNLQMCIPQLITLTKGKFAAASLLSLVDGPHLTPPSPTNQSSATILSPRKFRRPMYLRKIVPSRCTGEFTLHNITFAYPSRPTVPVLEHVSIYLPANETTFVVGGSGSGKSTLAQLLLRMYNPQDGMIQLDDQDVAYLDEAWMRQHVAGVSQNCILFDMSVHDNVALGLANSGTGRRPEDATREEVIEACRMALLHDFVRDLPDGYDTKLGNGGANLSGGQKQRLAIARARLRNPTVLILDEATSALDATSRILVFEAIKRWRRNQTTIVITHDLSQIGSKDFVYVLKGGSVVEQGYRYDLETAKDGEFRDMMKTQGATGGYLPEKDEQAQIVEVDTMLEKATQREKEDVESLSEEVRPFNLKHQSLARPSLRPVTLGNWMFDVVSELTKDAPTSAVLAARQASMVHRFVPPEAFARSMTPDVRPRRPSSVYIPSMPQTPTAAHTPTSRNRLSLQFSPTSPTFSSREMASRTSLATTTVGLVEDEEGFDVEKAALRRVGSEASRKRPRRAGAYGRGGEAVITVCKADEQDGKSEESPEQLQPFWSLMLDIFPTVPHKPLVALGVMICIMSGAMTPIFSFLLSRLMFEVSVGASNSNAINIIGGIVLSVAALDGIFLGLKYFVMQTAAMSWVTQIRKACYELVLAQDKRWFDKSENSAVRIVQVLVKDGDDARNLIAIVLGQFFVVGTMLSVGLVWALVRGWQLTLVGFAIGPIFAITMALQTNLVAKCEVRNKRAREEVAKGYYETISNIRGIRSMAFESVFQRQFDAATDRALYTGLKGAFVEGCTYGVATALIYLSEALLFYVGAVLIARGSYTYLQMVEVLNLVVFTVTIGSQLMAFTQKIAKSVQATRDFNKLLKLSKDTDESQGILQPTISGSMTFKNVSFAYPERPDAPVFRNISMTLAAGECVAVVGSSGSGKSTIAAMLQRLYEPSSGNVMFGHTNLASVDVHHLREHVAVVSQNPNLFDAKISENIAYGNKSLSEADVHRAAKAAHVHDFIMSLPQGYDTMVGENASLISGGQAQRLQVARALARPSKILILDECTSALDPANQAAVMDTIRDARSGRTTVMITHKVSLMQMCDRIVVIHDGVVAEEGTYEALMERKGVFFKLANGGEWMGA